MDSYADLYWSAADGQQIAARLWNVEQPVGTVLLTHGIGDHGGRWESVARYFNTAQMALLVPDLRGHGRSDGQRGFVLDFDHYLDDLDIAVDQAKRIHDAVPVTGWGQSFGGLLVLYHALRRKPALDALVASSPALEIAMPAPAWKVSLGRTLGKVFPRMSLPTNLKLGELSDDPQIESRARSDRYLHGRITPRTFFGMLEAGRWCLDHANELTIPALVMHGGRDSITRAVATEKFARNAPRCESRLWPSGMHELHNMKGGEAVLQFAVEWVRRTTCRMP